MSKNEQALIVGFVSAFALVAVGTTLGFSSGTAFRGFGPAADFLAMRSEISALESEKTVDRGIASADAACSSCAGLEDVYSGFQAIPDSRRAKLGSKQRKVLEEREVASLSDGAKLVLDLLPRVVNQDFRTHILPRKTAISRERLAIAKFIARTAPRDGAHVVLDRIAVQYPKSASSLFRVIEEDVIELAERREITLEQREAVRDAIVVVLSEVQD